MRVSLCAICVFSLCPGVYSHAYLAMPKSRNVLNCPGGGDNEHHCTAHIMTHDTTGLSQPVYPNNLAGQQYGKMIPQGPVCAANYEEPRAGGTNIDKPGPPQATYKAGDVIDVKIHVQANHGGYHAFRLCPNGETEECFKQHMLQWDSGETWREFKHDSRGGPGPGSDIHARVRLPADVACERCVLNWRWDGGGGGGDESVVFLNCADIKIEGKGGGAPSPTPSVSGDNRVIERAPGIGGWGGSCTCPDGQIYQVGDNGDACNSLACVGGTAGTCNRNDGSWSFRKVECAAAPVPAPTPVQVAAPTPAPATGTPSGPTSVTTQLKLHPGAKAQGHVMTLTMTAVAADKMKFELEVNKGGWIGIGISKDEGTMISGGDGTDLVFCSESMVGRRWMTSYTPDALNAASVEDASCTHAAGSTKLTFTREVEASSEMERALTPGTPQAVVYAYGEDGEAFGSHSVRRGNQAVSYPIFNANSNFLSGAYHTEDLYSVSAILFAVFLVTMN